MWSEIRELFPLHKNCVYLNNAGVAPPSLRVLEALDAYHQKHAEHGWMQVGSEYRDTGAQIKKILGGLLNCPASCLALTHNTSEGMNTVAQGLSWKPEDIVLGLDREYPANVYPWWNLEKKGVRYVRLSPSHSAADLASLEAHMADQVRVVSVSAVDWCSGYVPDLTALGDMCHARGGNSGRGHGPGPGGCAP